MRVLILGGDGYLGWPTAMHISSHGHHTAVVDNYLRRRICREENVEPLYDVPNLHKRAQLWERYSQKKIDVFIGDLTSWDFISDIFQSFSPEIVIHYAEQPAAPYSMMNRRSASLTLHNNLTVTANVIFAVKEYTPEAHIIKLGTMGEYGTPNIDIEEGWLTVEHKGRSQIFLYPRQAGSLYHTTKIMDTDLLWFYVRTWGLRVTDLMQGPVYGIFTGENEVDENLLPFFNYDDIFGTVINRFIVQAVCGYPLTVYGKGGQTRGYLNIKDTLSCIKLTVENPASEGELRILNQITETFSVKELAEKIQQVGNKMKFNVKIQSIDNPRKEEEEHYYNPKHTGLLDLGLTPNYLSDQELEKMMRFIHKYRNNINQNQILSKVRWS